MSELTRQLCAQCAEAHRFPVVAGGQPGECPSCREQVDAIQDYADPWAWKYVVYPATRERGRVIGADYRQFGKATEYVVAIGETTLHLGGDRCRTAIGLQLVELGRRVRPELVRACDEIERAKRESGANRLLFPPREFKRRGNDHVCEYRNRMD